MNHEDIFSPYEAKILKALGSRKMTIEQLTKSVYPSGRKPLHARNSVGGLTRRIAAKAKARRLKWRLAHEGGGRSGKIVWIERRN